ncbi:MAG TPA: penicillin-binding protein 2 [Dehalococcoidia bacterium]|nr:penicillin-binding protein 2 [Dehalococcoidia bacterium]
MGFSTGRKPWRSEPFQEPSDEDRASKQKLFFFALAVIFLFGILTIQLARLQLVHGDKYRLRAETNRLRQEPVLPSRGLIYDKNGTPLVANRASYAAAVVAADVPDVDLSADPPACDEGCDQIAIALQELTGVPGGDIEAKILERAASNDPFTPAVIKGDLTEAQAFMLREKLAGLPGVRVIVEPERSYTQGATMGHILGFVGAINEDEYASLEASGYQLNDFVGKTGVELTYESILRGKAGVREVETDASGREIRILQEKPAVSGASLVLSIDLDLQKKVEELLRAAMGKSENAAAAVIDVHTGDVLAMVSLPTYDNNVFAIGGEANDRERVRLLTDPAKPMVDHAIAEMYAPGSTFKQVTGLAALQEGVANANTLITSYGYIQVEDEYTPGRKYTFKDWRSDLGTMNFYRGVAMSSDVYFYYLAGGYSEGGKDLFTGLGAAKLADWSRRFGLGSPTGIDLPGESAGIVPDPTWKEKQVGSVWTIGDTYNFGIGQGYLTTTPMQMLLVTAAVANGGDVLTPHVVKELRDSNGNTIKLARQTVKRNLNIDPRNLNVMREGMRQSVADGAAFTGASKNVVVGGKTGTAEFGPQHADGNYDSHGWFTGFAPFNDPQIAVVVYLQHGNGQGTAAPVASKIFDYYFRDKNLAQGATP